MSPGIGGFVILGCYLKKWNPAAFGLLGAIISAASLHLHISYKFGVLGESWTKKRIRRPIFVTLLISKLCSISSITCFIVEVVEKIE